jgi:hypothetical protein
LEPSTGDYVPVREGSPRTAWLARVALLLAAVAAVAGAFGLARPRHVDPYACPMHAEVRAAAPGACPVCGMALERVKPSAAGAAPAAFAVARPDLVTVRPRVFSREVRAPARAAADGREIVALLHGDDLEPARAEEGGVFTPAEGAAVASVPILPVDAPPIAADDATSWARFRPAKAVPAGAVGWVSWPARPRAALALPDTAVIRDADGPYVLVASPDAPLGLEKRAVRVGKAFQSLAVVTSGLSPGERVVADGAFTWDVERRLRAAHAP